MTDQDNKAEKEQEELERKCWNSLMLVEDAKVLEEIGKALDLEISADIVGKTNLLFKFLLRSLNAESVQDSEDHGCAMFLKLWDLLEGEIKDIKENLEIKVENTIELLKPKNENVIGLSKKEIGIGENNPIFDIRKLKELKISGKIGGVGEKDKLSYVSLSYQISNAKKLGYSEEMICSSVIKAITPGSYLRTYLEGKQSLTLASLIEVMRSHFREKDSTSIFLN